LTYSATAASAQAGSLSPTARMVSFIRRIQY
jgi:hypothetical protein